MKALFYTALAAWILFEITRVYFIMPLPGSQRWDVVALAHALHQWRWPIRALILLLILAGSRTALRRPRRKPILALAILALVVFATNAILAADRMFLPLLKARAIPAQSSVVDTGRMVVGLAIGADACAYPIQYIGYHHQVRDTVGGRPVMVTYCTVCRSAGAYLPAINGVQQDFRLVGMDHFNALFEDRATGSWWQQSTGQCVAGRLKGQSLESLPTTQVRLADWLRAHPDSRILQPDAAFAKAYQDFGRY